jgi:hypothetical protein
MTEKQKEIVEAVRKHATANYENGGWDYVIECWSDEQILAQAGDMDLEKTIARIGKILGVVDDRRQDAWAERF